MKKLFLVILLAWVLGSTLAAQDAAEEEQGLFDGEGVIADVEEKEEEASAVLLRSDGVEIGGRFRFEASSSWTYDGAAGPFGADLSGDSMALDLGARVFLDARPSETFRVFGKTDISFPFTDQGGTRSFDEVFHVTELFSDFQLGDSVFFRAGKQTIHWGVGWFFSPADLLNITAIDPQDPEAEREGPIALKVQAPIGANNLYLYTVFEDAALVEEVALAPKAELVIGDSEIGVGAFYRAGNAPAAMTTLTTSYRNFRLFAEGILSYGSDRTFVVEDPASPTGVVARRYDDRVYPSATAGLTYRYPDDAGDFNVSVSAQYLYNGDGYEDPGFLQEQAAGIQALLAAGELSAADLAETGRHYGAVSGSWTGLLGSDFSLGGLWLGNLADGSGMVVPSIRWEVIDELDLSFKMSFRYGEAGDEYAPAGDGLTLTLAANFGGGSF